MELDLWRESVIRWLDVRFHESPELMLALSAALSLPVLAVAGTLWRMAWTRRPEPAKPLPSSMPSGWNRGAILEFARHDVAPFPISHGIVRIGRETDNDVCLDDPTVHRYHALIEQTSEAEFHIAYVGDPEGNGLYINGRRAVHQRLEGGEVLDIGAVKLRFTLTEGSVSTGSVGPATAAA